MPSYPGGVQAFYEFLYNNIIYPENEKDQNIEGTVFVNFVVEKDGTPTHFRISQGIEGGAGLDSTAINACRLLGKFNPGTQDGVPQRVYMTVPIKFTLADDGEDPAQERLSKSDLKQIKRDGKEICDIMYKLIEAKRAGDKVKIDKLISDLDTKLGEQHKYYSEVSARSEELEKIVEPCMEEATKAALGE